MASTNANGYWEVCSNLIIQERDYVFYIRYDSNQGAVIKIEKMGGSEVVDKIDMTLESAIEIEDRLRTMERRFNQIDPRFTNETLLSEDVDGVYHLSLSVIGNNPVLYVHHKRLKTNESMIIQGFPLFRCHLFDVIEELSIKYLDLKIVKWEESDARVVRGDRVAVIFCPSRPWPWINSDWTEQLLFDPQLILMLLQSKVCTDEIQFYCEQTYPQLFTMDDFTKDYQYLRVRWIRRGVQFRINKRPGFLTLKHEHEEWLTA